MRQPSFVHLVLMPLALGCGGGDSDDVDASAPADAGIDAIDAAVPTTSCQLGVSRAGPRTQLEVDVAFADATRETLTYPRIATTDSLFSITAGSDGSDCEVRVGGAQLATIPCTGQISVVGEQLGAGAVEVELVVGDGPFGATSCTVTVPIGFPRPCQTASTTTAHLGFRAATQNIGDLDRRFIYDDDGLIVRVDAINGLGQGLTTSIDYNGARQVIGETVVEENRLRTITYRGDGQPALFVEDLNDDGVDLRMTFEYSGAGQLESILEEDISAGNVFRHSYTYSLQTGLPVTRTVAVVSGTGVVGSTYVHDEIGNLTIETKAGSQDSWDYSCFAP